MNKSVTCNKCGWVHFEVSREYAQNEVQHFGEYFRTLTLERQEEYYGGRPGYIEDYEHCGLCNNSYKNFRDSVEGDCPDGSTQSPIINRND